MLKNLSDIAWELSRLDYGIKIPQVLIQKVFSNADFAGNKNDRLSTSGTCQLLGNALISWNSKKQNCVSISTTEAEYIAIGLCCA